jgi:hypothetical protein
MVAGHCKLLHGIANADQRPGLERADWETAVGAILEHTA